MTYKDLNVYQRAYKVAISLHQFLEKDGGKFTTDEINQLKSMSKILFSLFRYTPPYSQKCTFSYSVGRFQPSIAPKAASTATSSNSYSVWAALYLQDS